MTQRIRRRAALAVLAFVMLLGEAVGTANAASNLDNACSLFRERIGWFTIANDASKKWDVPVPAILSVMYHESRFKADASTKTTTAFGYAQALDGTWEQYKTATKASSARRTSFADSVDFIGWYMTETEQKIGVPLDDVKAQYLTYHQGRSGYRSKRWMKKPDLIKIANAVVKLSETYEEQMYECGLMKKDADKAETITAKKELPVLESEPFALAELSVPAPRRKPITALFAEARTSANAYDMAKSLWR